MSEYPTLPEVLRGAHDAILTRGWHKGGSLGPEGEVCLEEAILVACPHVSAFPNDSWEWPDSRFKRYREADRAVLDAIHRKYPRGTWRSVAGFNDARHRTLDHVLDVLLDAEKHAADEEA